MSSMSGWLSSGPQPHRSPNCAVHVCNGDVGQLQAAAPSNGLALLAARCARAGATMRLQNVGTNCRRAQTEQAGQTGHVSTSLH